MLRNMTLIKCNYLRGNAILNHYAKSECEDGGATCIKWGSVQFVSFSFGKPKLSPLHCQEWFEEMEKTKPEMIK